MLNILYNAIELEIILLLFNKLNYCSDWVAGVFIGQHPNIFTNNVDFK